MSYLALYFFKEISKRYWIDTLLHLWGKAKQFEKLLESLGLLRIRKKLPQKNELLEVPCQAKLKFFKPHF